MRVDDKYTTDDESDVEVKSPTEAINSNTFASRDYGQIAVNFKREILNLESLNLFSNTIKCADDIMKQNCYKPVYKFHVKEDLLSKAIIVTVNQLYESFKNKKEEIKSERKREQTVFKKLERCAKKLENDEIMKVENFIETNFKREPEIEKNLKDFFTGLIKETGRKIIESYRTKESNSLPQTIKHIKKKKKSELKFILKCASLQI